MRAVTVTAFATLTRFTAGPVAAQSAPKTLVATFAHGDDEGSIAPILARYAARSASSPRTILRLPPSRLQTMLRAGAP